MTMQYNSSVGILNKGNTCFANASVQLICCSDTFQKYLHDHESSTFRTETEIHLALLVRNLQTARERDPRTRSERTGGSSHGPIKSSPRSIEGLLRAVRTRFADDPLLQKLGVQFDPGEFLQLLLMEIPGLRRNCAVTVIPRRPRCSTCDKITVYEQNASVHVHIDQLETNATTATIIQKQLAELRTSKCTCGQIGEATVSQSSVLLLEIERRSLVDRTVNCKPLVYSLAVPSDTSQPWILHAVLSFLGQDNAGHCSLFRVDHNTNTLERLSDATRETGISLDCLKNGTIVASVLLYERMSPDASPPSEAKVSETPDPGLALTLAATAAADATTVTATTAATGAAAVTAATAEGPHIPLTGLLKPPPPVHPLQQRASTRKGRGKNSFLDVYDLTNPVDPEAEADEHRAAASRLAFKNAQQNIARGDAETDEHRAARLVQKSVQMNIARGEVETDEHRTARLAQMNIAGVAD